MLDALRDLRRVPDAEPAKTLKRIVKLCREKKVSFDHMERVARAEPPRVRALLGLIGTFLGLDEAKLAPLRRALNPTATFKLGLAEAFPEAVLWQIR